MGAPRLLLRHMWMYMDCFEKREKDVNVCEGEVGPRDSGTKIMIITDALKHPAEAQGGWHSQSADTSLKVRVQTEPWTKWITQAHLQIRVVVVSGAVVVMKIVRSGLHLSDVWCTHCLPSVPRGRHSCIRCTERETEACRDKYRTRSRN